MGLSGSEAFVPHRSTGDALSPAVARSCRLKSDPPRLTLVSARKYPDSFDNPDSLGRLHKRFVKRAATLLKKALAEGNAASVEQYSRMMSRHTRDLVMVMQWKQSVVISVDKLDRASVFEKPPTT